MKTNRPRAIGTGTILFGSAELNVCVLDDGRQVISESSIAAAFAGNPQLLQLDRVLETGGRATVARIEFVGLDGTIKCGHDCYVFVELCRAFASMGSDYERLPKSAALSDRAVCFLCRFACIGLQLLINEASRYPDLQSGAAQGNAAAERIHNTHSTVAYSRKSAARRRRRRERNHAFNVFN